MATNWSQGGQYSGSGQYGIGATAQAYERPPTCFNCGQEGHFVINCPESSRSTPSGPSATPSVGHSQNGNVPGYGAQPSQYNNQATGAVVTRYPAPKNAPIVTRYSVPTSGAAPGAGAQGAPGTYAPLVQQPQQYQQYSASTNQPYPHQASPPQTPYAPYSQNQSYNGPQSYGQTPQSYGAGAPSQQQYGYQGYQVPPQGYSPYSQPAAPQPYNPPYYQNPTQSYPQYQSQPDHYQTQNGNYDQNNTYGAHPASQAHGPPQWNQASPSASPYNAPPYQQPQAQYNPGYHSQYDPNVASYPQQQAQQIYGSGGYEYQQPAQDAGYGYPPNQQGSPYAYQGAPSGQQYITNSSQRSRSSSIASTPYGSRRGSIASAHGPRERPASSNKQRKVKPAKELSEPPSVEDQEFNWDFKKIFQEDSHQPAVPISRPFPNSFEDDTSSLFANTSTDTVSRYASKNHLKEFKQSIKSSYQWPLLQQDPAFSDMKHEAPLIPLDRFIAWKEERNRKDTNLDTKSDRNPSLLSRKRAWSDEQEETHKLISQEAFPEDQHGSPGVKRQKNNDAPLSITTISNDIQGIRNVEPRTPNLNRASTPVLSTEDDAWAPQAGEGEDPTEAKLAALGVSGAPKPVHPMEQAPLLETFNSSHDYGCPPQRQDSGYLSAHGSQSNGPDPSTTNPNEPNPENVPQWPTQTTRTSSANVRRLDGAGDAPSPTDVNLSDNGKLASSNGLEQNDSPSTLEPAETPAQDPLPRRKIVRVISGKKAETLRQVDDVTPKFKRTQPVVAEAYSRRW